MGNFFSAGIKLASGGTLQVCEVCSDPFVHYRKGSVAKRCPKCQDERQGRPTVVQSRSCEWEMDGVRVHSLPTPAGATWVEFHPIQKDDPSYRTSVKGSIFGAEWDGRLELYAPEPILPGRIVRVRAMLAQHRTKVVQETRQTLEHGPVPVQREVGLNADEGEETVLERRYLVLEPSQAEFSGAELVWDIAYTKTTLKGLGRQFWAEVTGAPIQAWRITGGARSGRFRTTGVLAVVDREHPLVVKGTGDVEFERMYPVELSRP